MKVLFSAGMIQGGRSGVGRYAVRIAEGLAGESDIDLTVAGLRADRGHFPQIADDHWLEIPKSATGGLRNLVWHQRALPGELRRGKFDLVHIPSYRRILWRSPVPQITTIHDCAPFVLREKYGIMRGIFGRWLTPLVARRCEKVIAVSEVTADHIQRFLKVPSGRVEVVLNGIDHSFFRPPEPVELKRFRKRENLTRPYFLYVSRLEHPGKNHVGLVEAYEQFRRNLKAEEIDACQIPELVLVGADWKGCDTIHQRVKKSEFRVDIRMQGFAEESDLPNWYAGSKGMVMPSFFEGFGLPLVEAMACGCPVAVSDLKVFHEVAGDTASYFDPNCSDAISGALKEMAIRGEEESEARANAGIQRAKCFSWDRAVSRIQEIYQQVGSNN